MRFFICRNERAVDGSIRQFPDVVDECELMDLGFQGMPLTWSNG